LRGEPNIGSRAIVIVLLIQATGVSAAVYLGNFPIMFLCLNAALCGWFYNWMLVRPRTSPTNTSSQHANTPGPNHTHQPSSSTPHVAIVTPHRVPNAK
jgi:hypothetical protein